MSSIEQSRMEKISANVYVGTNAITGSHLLGLARNYKKQVASRFRLLNEGDIKHLNSKSLHASLKLDGQLHFYCKQGEESFLFNPKGRAIKGLPCLAELDQQWSDHKQVVLAGELYCQTKEGRARVYDVTSALSPQSTVEHPLAYAAFDVLELDGESFFVSFTKRIEALSKAMPFSGLSHCVENHEVDVNALSSLYSKWVVEEEQEGIVCVDDENHTIYKIKPRHNVDAVILGFTESPDVPDSLRVLLIGLMRPDGSFQVFAKVGTGFDDEERREFYRLLKPMAVESTYSITDRNYTLFTMVRPEVIIEMAFHDLIYENASGKPEMKSVLSYSPESGYTPLLPEPFVSVLGPVFKRLRDDKAVNTTDLRLTQLKDFVDLDNLEASSRNVDLANSSILQREVFSKTTKGLVSVRKFLSFKTNKENLDENYPAYVFCFVDYSPGRASPLKRVIRTAMTEDKVNEIFSKYKENEVKRGWVAA